METPGSHVLMESPPALKRVDCITWKVLRKCRVSSKARSIVASALLSLGSLALG